jgi:micrococcal nuclease
MAILSGLTGTISGSSHSTHLSLTLTYAAGQREVALAHQASARLQQLLNGNAFTVDTAGVDRYGRVLATIRIGGTDVGDILISEGLERRWPNGEEWWC